MRYLCCIMLVLYSLDVLSQDTIKTIYLDSVQVRASKLLPSKQAPSGDDLNALQLQATSSQNIGDASKYLSGTMVRDYGGLGGVKAVSIRGLSSNHTAVLYDGIGVFDNQSGQIDLGKYSLNNTSSISLANANFHSFLPTASSLANAGVIYIENKKPDLDDKKVKGNFSLLYGSYNMFSLSTFVAMKVNKKHILSLFSDVLNTDGKYHYKLYYGNNQQLSTQELTRKNNDLFSYHNELNWYYTINSKSSLKLKAYHYYSNRGLPNSVSLYYNLSKQRLWNENAFAQSSFISHISENITYKNNLKFDWNYTHYKDPLYLGYPQGEDDTYNQYLTFMNNALCLEKDKLTLCLTNDVIFSKLNSSMIDINPQRVSVLSALVTNYSLNKMNIDFNLLHSLFVDKYNNTKQSNYLSPYLSIEYNFGHYSVGAFYKNIFRMPTFNELYYRQIGNLDLKPEKTNQLSLTNKYTANYKDLSFIVEADIYYNQVKQKIVAIPRNVFLWSMLNYGKVDMVGVDIKLNMDYTINLIETNIKINYSFCKAEDKDKSSFTYNQQLPYMPEHVVTAVIYAKYKALALGYSCQYVSKRYSLKENIPSNLLKAYLDNNINLSYNFDIHHHKLSTTFSINNIFDKQYEIIRSYPMMGRNYNFKITFQL